MTQYFILTMLFYSAPPFWFCTSVCNCFVSKILRKRPLRLGSSEHRIFILVGPFHQRGCTLDIASYYFTAARIAGTSGVMSPSVGTPHPEESSDAVALETYLHHKEPHNHHHRRRVSIAGLKTAGSAKAGTDGTDGGHSDRLFVQVKSKHERTELELSKTLQLYFSNTDRFLTVLKVDVWATIIPAKIATTAVSYELQVC